MRTAEQQALLEQQHRPRTAASSRTAEQKALLEASEQRALARTALLSNLHRLEQADEQKLQQARQNAADLAPEKAISTPSLHSPPTNAALQEDQPSLIDSGNSSSDPAKPPAAGDPEPEKVEPSATAAPPSDLKSVSLRLTANLSKLRIIAGEMRRRSLTQRSKQWSPRNARSDRR